MPIYNEIEQVLERFIIIYFLKGRKGHYYNYMYYKLNKKSIIKSEYMYI